MVSHAASRRMRIPSPVEVCCAGLAAWAKCACRAAALVCCCCSHVAGAAARAGRAGQCAACGVEGGHASLVAAGWALRAVDAGAGLALQSCDNKDPVAEQTGQQPYMCSAYIIWVGQSPHSMA
jgi:hypothetical protein